MTQIYILYNSKAAFNTLFSNVYILYCQMTMVLLTMVNMERQR